MATRIRFSEYFGFTDEEVDVLYRQYLKKTCITRESLREGYDGYHTATLLELKSKGLTKSEILI